MDNKLCLEPIGYTKVSSIVYMKHLFGVGFKCIKSDTYNNYFEMVYKWDRFVNSVCFGSILSVMKLESSIIYFRNQVEPVLLKYNYKIKLIGERVSLYERNNSTVSLYPYKRIFYCRDQSEGYYDATTAVEVENWIERYGK